MDSKQRVPPSNSYVGLTPTLHHRNGNKMPANATGQQEKSTRRTQHHSSLRNKSTKNKRNQVQSMSQAQCQDTKHVGGHFSGLDLLPWSGLHQYRATCQAANIQSLEQAMGTCATMFCEAETASPGPCFGQWARPVEWQGNPCRGAFHFHSFWGSKSFQKTSRIPKKTDPVFDKNDC